MSDGTDWLGWLARTVLRPGEPLFRPSASPYEPQAAGVLTPEILRHALDEACRPPHQPPPRGHWAARQPFGLRPVAPRPPDWAVEVDGYRLVIRGGAIVGLEHDG